ncbi:Dolichyl-phosphate-mannose--protein mannosyltransferase 4 [Tieghemiomyces parasiticus]|uniref:Dolichyl-phosphate-mannose--protein mannosyltransferase n=1 Tax=Tieghemiomyces parasiticus TaxID=78921 RepID=A0A9W7ZP65_9FUNG|nr:Dolichyl-phosphate-mannose--protein mannosyltransferase 4 [Tieghemiomyces parasiticus]
MPESGKMASKKIRQRASAHPETKGNVTSSSSPSSPEPSSPIELCSDGKQKSKASSGKLPASVAEKVATSPAVSALTAANPNRLGLALVLLLSFVTRFYKLWAPAEVVFDEVHFGKFAAYYIRRTYFFDVHPPLAKMLIAAHAYLVGFDGGYLFDKIGENYIERNVPYISMRAFPALLGTLLPVLSYLIMIESGYSVYTAFLVGMLIVFDNAMVVQSRLILLDTFMLLFLLGAVFFYIRFYKARYTPFTRRWWTRLALTGVCLGLVTSVKLVGLLTVGMVGVAVLTDLWRLLDVERGLTIRQWSHHFAARAVGLIIIPVAVYVAGFYVHFAVLNRSGPGDTYMSPAFQGSLLDNPLHASSTEIRFGQSITLKHKSTAAYLHSHAHNYPLRYTSGRVSSQGQQVTGYGHKDVNNFWTVLPAVNETETTDVVRNGDLVRLYHVKTQSYLLTHDVASPLTATNMEMTTVGDDKVGERYNETLWRLEIDKASVNRTHWTTSASSVRLIHEKQGVVILGSSQKLPDWGFNQFEINGNKKPEDAGAVWVAEDIEGVDAAELAKRHRPPTPISFWRKFFELNRVMIERNAALTKSHPYQSNAITWPFVVRGVSYWTSAAERQQIYFMGHPTGWWMVVGALVALLGLLAAQILAARRHLELIPPLVSRHLERSGGFLLWGYLIHYVPFFVMGRALFLHHYLPALLFGYMVVGVLFQYIFVEDYGRFALRSVGGRVRNLHISGVAAAVLAGILALHIVVFFYFAPLSYGSPQTLDQILHHKWFSSWDLQYAK